MGFPIRKSADQRLFAPPHGLSQRTTSFIASQRQGIHRIPLRHLIALIIDAHHSAWRHRKKDQFASNTPGSVAVKQRPLAGALVIPPCGVRRPDMFSLHDVDRTRKNPRAHANGFGRTRRFRKNDRRYRRSGGARRDRTDDLMLAKHALSQLSYGPKDRTI